MNKNRRIFSIILIVICFLLPPNTSQGEAIEPWKLSEGSFLLYEFTHIEQVGTLNPIYKEFSYKISLGDQIRFEFYKLNLSHAMYTVAFIMENGTEYNRNSAVKGAIQLDGTNFWENNEIKSAGSVSHGIPFPCYPQTLNITSVLQNYNNPEQGCSKFLRLKEGENNLTFYAHGCAGRIEKVVYDTTRNIVTSMKRYLSFYLIEANLIKFDLPANFRDIPGFSFIVVFGVIIPILVFEKRRRRLG